VDMAVRSCKENTRQSGTGRLIEGDAADVLTAATADADLVVVGSRGPSGFKTVLFGSVALFTVEHAACPVAVLHPSVRAASSTDDGDIRDLRP